MKARFEKRRRKREFRKASRALHAKFHGHERWQWVVAFGACPRRNTRGRWALRRIKKETRARVREMRKAGLLGNKPPQLKLTVHVLGRLE